MSTAARRRPRWVLAAPTLSLALVVTGAAPASADQADDRALLASTTITASMLTGSVVDLGGGRAASSVFDLGVEGAVVGLETSEEAGGTAIVTLTSDLLFEFGEYALTPASVAALAGTAAGIGQGAAVAVDGYTDSLGGDAINIPLSQQRAQAVAAALAATRPDLVLTVAGHGSADEVAPNQVDGADNPVGRALNRRVTLTYATP